jgi:hypothetical protein
VEDFCRAGEAPDDNKMRRIRCSCCTNKATNALSECVIFIAFPLQQWLRERGSILCCMYIAYLVGSAIKIALLFFVHTYGVSATCFTFFAASINYFHSTSTSLYCITVSSLQARSRSVEKLLASSSLSICWPVCPSDGFFVKFYNRGFY